MELRDALRLLRSEIGLTQTQLAEAVNVGFTAASRWENQNTRPNRASSAALLALARKHCVSAECLDALTTILLASRADDKKDKEKLKQVTEQMKLEDRVLLTCEQMKTTIDNLDLAVIVQRIYAVRADGIRVIYQNRRYAEIFGFTAEEFEERCREDIYFCISLESRDAYLHRLAGLIAGQIPLSQFSMTMPAAKKDGSVIWLELKGIHLTRYSYGHELCLSCRDVTQRIEAERRYAEEVAVRDASLQGFFASFYCDLTANTVLRCRDLAGVTGCDLTGASADEVLHVLGAAIEGKRYRDAFADRFDRSRLLLAYEKKDTFGFVRFFNTAARRWLRCDYVLISNPYTQHIEAAVYLYDIQAQTIAERMMDVVADHYFEYIGLIDTEKGTFEAFYYATGTFRSTVEGKRDYKTVCEDKLVGFSMAPEAHERHRRAVSLETVRQKLSAAKFYSVVLPVIGYEGERIDKKVTYTYLDDTHTLIVMAQSAMLGTSQSADFGRSAVESS